MNNFLFVCRRMVSLVLLSFFVTACQNYLFPIEQEVDSMPKGNGVQTKSFFLEEASFFVSLEDMQQYVAFVERYEGKDTKKGEAKEIIPVQISEEVAFYVVNYEAGWQIVSSDKRGPVVLAESQYGSFCYEDAVSSVKDWLGMLYEDIQYRRLCSDEYYANISKEGQRQEEFSLTLWEAVKKGSFSDLAGIATLETKGPPSEPPGRYELSYTYTTTEYAGVNHLMTTHWRQGNPYNTYCPLVSNNGTDRCLVGCVNVAGSQVLYYLHYQMGRPISSPTAGYSYGPPGNHTYNFWGFSSSTWDVMDTNNDTGDYRGLFIGSVAHLSHTDFGENGSSAEVSDLKNYTFPFYGVSSTYSTSYNRDTVQYYLLAGQPVIYGGNRFAGLFNWPGHAWVIDGYINEITVYHDVYEWVYLDEPTGPVPSHNPYEILSYSTELKYFKMNWGWGNYNGEDDAMYATTGSWPDPLVTGSGPYIYSRELMYHFR